MSKRSNNRDESTIRALFSINNPSVELQGLLKVMNIKDIFRLNPRALMRIISSNKEIRSIIEFKEKEEQDFWYYICKYAFPDILIYLYTFIHHYKDDIQLIDDLFFNNKGDDRIRQICLEEGNGSGYIRFNFKEDISNGSPYIKSEVFYHIDRSFTDINVLDRCLKDDIYARFIEDCFKMITPCGIPPEEYCFSSQVKLRELFIQLVIVIYKSKKIVSTLMSYLTSTIMNKYSIIGNIRSEGNFIYFYRAVIPLSDVIKIKKSVDDDDDKPAVNRIIVLNGKGPIGRENSEKKGNIMVDKG